MASEAIRASKHIGEFAGVVTRNGERVLIISSDPETALGRDDEWQPHAGPKGRQVSTNEQLIPLSRQASATALREIAREHRIERLYVSLPLSHCSLLESVCDVASELGLELSVRLTLANRQLPAASHRDLTFEAFRHPANRFPGRLMKRFVDLTGASFALVLLSPLMFLIAAAVKLTSSGPVFFLQPRIGLRCRTFRMLKFRTMVADAEQRRSQVEHQNHARGISFKVINDPRLTCVGGILRRMSLDEIPQLINVLRGEMSLVGPRPIPTWVAEQLDDTRYHRRFSVLPGMTGLWQVRGRRQDFDYMAERDIEYVGAWNIWLDLRLLAETPLAVIRGEGAH